MCAYGETRNRNCIHPTKPANDIKSYFNCPVLVRLHTILTPLPTLTLLAWSCNALKNGSTPVPASAGNPNVRTKSPNKPVRSAMSRLRTAARNCGACTTRSSVSTVGALGRSGGRCGKSDATRSGRAAKSGRRFAGVRTSLREMSGCWCWAWAREEEAPEPGLVPREVTMERMRASSSGVA